MSVMAGVYKGIGKITYWISSDLAKLGYNVALRYALSDFLMLRLLASHTILPALDVLKAIGTDRTDTEGVDGWHLWTWTLGENLPSHADSHVGHFPMQNSLKIVSSVSCGVICPPVMSARWSRTRRKSSAKRSAERESDRPARTRWRDSWAESKDW